MNCLLVIPHFRHLDRLETFLPTLAGNLSADFSVRVSDDGSGGDTARSLEKLMEAQPSRAGHAKFLPPLIAPANKGKGHAVYAGWRSGGDSDWLAFVDADGAVPAREIQRAWDHLAHSGQPPDVLIGSRVAMLGRDVRRTHYRHYSGRVFATIASIVSGLHVYDSQCGLKFIRAQAFQKIEPFVKAQRFSFDMELLMFAAASGSRIEEFPIDWSDVPGGKVSVARDSLPMLLELFRARLNARNYQHSHARSSSAVRTAG